MDMDGRTLLVIWKGRRKPGRDGAGEARHRGGRHTISFSVSSQNRISLTECRWVFRAVGSEPGRHPCRLAPKIAIHGDFALRIPHSVSEIADFSQRLKKRWCAVLPYAALPLLHPSLAYAAPSILPIAV